jgi:ABC-type branched-subunit amino acid transport system substrate-binding protein
MSKANPRRRRRKAALFPLVLVGLACAVALAACGSSDSDSGGSSGGGTAAAAPTGSVTTTASSAKLRGKPFKIMVITGIDVPFGNQPAAGPAVEAAVNHVNSDGGFGGRPGVVEVCNHQGTAAGTQACAQKAVDSNVDQVFCLCSFPNANATLDGAKIPRFAASGQTDTDFRDPLNFMLNGSSGEAYAGAAFALKRQGATKIAAVGNDIAANHALTDYVAMGARAAGSQFLGLANVPVNTTDYSSTVQQLKGMNPDAVVLLIAPASYPSFFQTARELGLTDVKYVMPAFAVGDPDIKALGSAADGLMAFSPIPPFGDTSFPIVKQYRDDMANVKDCCRPYEFSAYIGVYALKALADRVRGEVTKESLVKAANDPATGALDVAGVQQWEPWKRGPSLFPRAPDGVGWYVRVDDGQIVLDGPKTPFDLWRALGVAQQ